MVCWEFKLYIVKFYCCSMWQIWVVFHVEGCGVSKEFLVVHSWKMAQDVGMV